MSAYDKAVDILMRREHTEKELRVKLEEKGYEEEEIDEAVETLLSEGYLSDERFAEVYIRSRMRKAAEGKSHLIMRLVAKGVGKETAAAAVENAWNDEGYLEGLIREWTKLRRKYGDEKAGKKLLEKGFSYSEIKRAEEESENED